MADDFYADYRFFIKPVAGGWSEVTAKEFKAAERAAGFHPKGGGDGFATAGFGTGNVQGTMVNGKWFADDAPVDTLSEDHPYREIIDFVRATNTEFQACQVCGAISALNFCAACGSEQITEKRCQHVHPAGVECGQWIVVEGLGGVGPCVCRGENCVAEDGSD